MLNLYQLVRLKRGRKQILDMEDIEGQLEEVRCSESLSAPHSFWESPLLGHLEGNSLLQVVSYYAARKPHSAAGDFYPPELQVDQCVPCSVH